MNPKTESSDFRGLIESVRRLAEELGELERVLEAMVETQEPSVEVLPPRK